MYRSSESKDRRRRIRNASGVWGGGEGRVSGAAQIASQLSLRGSHAYV